jgi:hypothetical protein
MLEPLPALHRPFVSAAFSNLKNSERERKPSSLLLE